MRAPQQSDQTGERIRRITGPGHKILCLKRRATYHILWYVSAHRRLSRSYTGNVTSVASRVGDEGGLAVPFEVPRLRFDPALFRGSDAGAAAARANLT